MIKGEKICKDRADFSPSNNLMTVMARVTVCLGLARIVPDFGGWLWLANKN